MDTLSFSQSRLATTLAIKADAPIVLQGPPGVGKSALMGLIGPDVGLPVHTLILSLCDPTDIGGFPVANGGALDRLPLGAIKACCDAPGLLFLDELSQSTPPVQAASMRLILDRWAGDRRLHPATRIVSAMNPPDQAAGGFDLALPLIGRVARINFRPTVEEVRAYFDGIGADGSTLRALGVDFSATLSSAPTMLQIDPPPGAQSTGAKWGSPRDWERALRTMAEGLDAGESDQGAIVGALTSGSVGEECAGAFLAIRKIRTRLPSVDAIVLDPLGSALPSDTSVESAIPGVLAQVALKDPCSAYVYATRLNPEIQMVSARILIGKPIDTHKRSPHFANAQKSRIKLLGLAGKATAGVL